MLKYRFFLLIYAIFLHKNIFTTSYYNSMADYQASLSTIEFSPDIDTLAYLEDGQTSHMDLPNDSYSLKPVAQEDILEKSVTNISIENS